MRHFGQVTLTAAVFTLATWSIWEWKGMVALIPFWAIFEVVYRIRVRALLSCPHCGFDPYLYLTDVGRAKSAIETYWRAKFAERGIPYPGDPAPEVSESIQGSVQQDDETPEQSDESRLEER